MYLLSFSIFCFSTRYRKQMSSRFTCKSFCNIVTFFFIPGTKHKFDKNFFKVVVMKCIVETFTSLLLKPSCFIHNLTVFILTSVFSLEVFNMERLSYQISNIYDQHYLLHIPSPKLALLVGQTFLVVL